MARNRATAGWVNRLAGRGEEAVTRLVEELGKNPRVTDALSRVMDAKTKIDQSARGAVAQAGLAADELKEPASRSSGSSAGLAKLESTDKPAKPAAAKKTTAKKTETKKAPTAKKCTTVKKDAEGSVALARPLHRRRHWTRLERFLGGDAQAEGARARPRRSRASSWLLPSSSTGERLGIDAHRRAAELLSASGGRCVPGRSSAGSGRGRASSRRR